MREVGKVSRDGVGGGVFSWNFEEISNPGPVGP